MRTSRKGILSGALLAALAAGGAWWLASSGRPIEEVANGPSAPPGDPLASANAFARGGMSETPQRGIYDEGYIEPVDPESEDYRFGEQTASLEQVAPFVEAWSYVDAEAAAAFAEERFGGHLSRQDVVMVFMLWARKDFAGVTEMIGRLPEHWPPHDFVRILMNEGWKQDPALPVSFATALPVGEAKDVALAWLGDQWVQTDPATAAEWALTNLSGDSPEIVNARDVIARTYALNDAESAARWAALWGDGATRGEIADAIGETVEIPPGP